MQPESKTANSAVSQKSITYLTQTMGERLTQLILANNTLTCLPQIITSLAVSIIFNFMTDFVILFFTFELSSPLEFGGLDSACA